MSSRSSAPRAQGARGDWDRKTVAPGKGRKPSRPSSSVPFPWDGKSEVNRRRIEANYIRVHAEVVRAALDGERPTSQLVKQWHVKSLVTVRLAEPWVAGHY